MRYGRINERNIGNWTLNSEPKRRIKKEKVIELNKEQEKAVFAVDMINSLIKSHNSNYVSYIQWNEGSDLVEHWKKNGIITKRIRKADPRFFGTDKEVCELNINFISDLNLSKQLLIEMNNLKEYYESIYYLHS